jgi:hypothetical protein
MANRQLSRFERELASHNPPPRTIRYHGSYYWPATREWFAIEDNNPSAWIRDGLTRGIATPIIAIAAVENTYCVRPWTFGQCRKFLARRRAIETDATLSDREKKRRLQSLRQWRERDVRRRNEEASDDGSSEEEEEDGSDDGDEDSEQDDDDRANNDQADKDDNDKSIEKTTEEDKRNGNEDTAMTDADDDATLSPTSTLSDSFVGYNGADQSTLSNIIVAPGRNQGVQDPPDVLPSTEQVPRGERITNAVNLWRATTVSRAGSQVSVRATPQRPTISPLTTPGRGDSVG